MNAEIEPTEEKAPKPLCLNCEKQMPRKAKFCPNCGQPNNKGRVTMRDMLEKVWHNFTHTDGKFLKMCAHLILPSRVTMEYFRGRQKRYPHPFQFFFVAMFFFILSVNHFWNQNFHEKSPADSGFKFNLNIENDTLKSTESMSVQQVFDEIKQHAINLRWQKSYRDLPASFKTTEAKRLIDTLFREQFSKTEALLKISRGIEQLDSTDVWNPKMDSLPIGLGLKTVDISVEDFAFTSADEIVKKYKIEVWWEQILLKQSLKTLRDWEGLKRSFLGSFTWTIIAQTALLALFLMLLYRNLKQWYVEHFLFLLNFHTSVLLCLALTLIAKFFIGGIWMWTVFFVWAGVHLYFSMRNFYHAGQGPLVFKYLVFNLVYWFFFLLLFAIGSALVFFFF